MGQYWVVVNIDKRQHLGHWGKLGECLFDGSPSTLVNFLAVPPQTSTSHRDDSVYGVVANGDWAGDRIICVGDYAADIPEGMLDDDEVQEFAQLTHEEACRTGDEAVGDIELHTLALAYFDRPRNRFFRTAGFTNDEVWVLRNLTKHEYVRADAVILHSDEMEGPFLAEPAQGRRPGLGEALMSRISWSTDSSASMSYDKIGITRGVWAGDRFDIRTLDTVTDDSEDAGKWKDVSKEVAEEVFEIWTADYGDTWKEDGRAEE